MHYQNFLIAALAISAPLSLALPFAEPEPTKDAPATTQEAEVQNINAKPTWLSIPIIDPTKLYPTPAAAVKSESVTTKGEEQSAQSSLVVAAHAAEASKGGKNMNGRDEREKKDMEESDDKGKPTGGLAEPDSGLEPTATGKPDTDSVPAITAKPTQHFTAEPDTEATATATATAKPDTALMNEIRNAAPAKSTGIFISTTEGNKGTATSKPNTGETTSTPVKAISVAALKTSVVVFVPVASVGAAGGKGV
ncbi:hypothetical protein SBOR_5799 [Sclerotinia borealis F-4128]|uniref:Uncharacterized protein n=1 Tax=Sclerotinia borealis (strain F-4128) TaxID=1432307 RepID=W9CGF1_SCLBF|nr:hypothetical protein SBOR_5799 [Sclerotinia borealis F-4128]